MKARKKGTNDEFVPFGVTLKDNWTIYNQDDIEFDTEQTPASDNAHWQDVRERAAIAAMNGTMTILSSSDRYAFSEIVVAGFTGNKKTYPNEIAEFAIACADALVEQLKKKTK